MRGNFHMEEYKHMDHVRGQRGKVIWQLNLKDDEDLRHGDAFLHDYMLDYAGQVHSGYDNDQSSGVYEGDGEQNHPILRQLLSLNEMKNLAEEELKDDEDDEQLLESEDELEREIEQHE